MTPPPIYQIEMCDPSELYRPEDKYDKYNNAKKSNKSRTEKEQDEFRNYKENLQREAVLRTYTLMHTHQTMEFVRSKIQQYGKLDKTSMTIMDAVFMLNALVDESDPDTDLPNSLHAFQTAERIRKDHPDKDWFHFVGLVHDLGKVLAMWGEPQWSVVGDTFPLGCAFSNKIVFPNTFTNNPDYKNTDYSTKYGIYSPNCGLDKVVMSWGHDEYMYRVLKGNNCTIPEEGLYMVRFHSFYPWHSGEDYNYLCSEKDREMLPWVLEFNKYDLYSKSDEVPDVEALQPYYQGLIDKYCPGQIQW